MSKLTSIFRKMTASNTSPANKTDQPALDFPVKSNTPKEQTRWNGWGNININKAVSPHGAKLIKSHIGKLKTAFC